MPRNGSGVYSLPAGNPVAGGAVIDVAWANPTMADIAVQMNNVLTRDGLLGPTLPLLFVDGTSALPGAAFALQSGTGMFRTALNLGFSFAGVQKVSIFNTGVALFDSAITVPTGAGTTSSAIVYAQSDTANSSFLSLTASTTEVFLNSSKTGTGTLRPMLFKVDATEHMQIATSGRVGIGGAPTTYKLEVTDAISVIQAKSTGGSATLQATGSGTNVAYLRLGNVTSGLRGQVKADNTGILTFSNGVTPTDRMFIDAAGLVGIGAAPTVAFDVNVADAAMRLNSSTTSNGALFTAVNGGGTLRFGRDNSGAGNFASGAYAVGFWNVGNQDMVFATNNIMRLRLTAAGAILDGSGNSLNNKNYPQNIMSGNYSIVASDAGKSLHFPGGVSGTITLSDGVFGIGDFCVISNNAGFPNAVKTNTDTMYWLATSGAGVPRTIGENTIITCLRISATRWIISGVGIS